MNARSTPKDYIDPAKEALAAKALIDSIRASGEDDEALLIDMVEGETGLFEIIDQLLHRRALNLSLAKGLEGGISDLEARKTRFKHRADTDKTLIEQAMSIAEIKTVERPEATLVLSNRAPQVVITEEADIPATFWKPSDPTLDKKALLQALKDRAAAMEALTKLDPEDRGAAIAALPAEIPGATLSNAAPSLTIRTK